VSGRKLYHVIDATSAYAYPIGVGRDGFSWTGVEKVSRIASWPDWHPPEEMRKRQPYLPVKMTGGVANPLGARAIYLGNTLYRIHGTNDPKSIGGAESSGCFRMMNEHFAYLATRVQVGADVHVVKSLGGKAAPEPAASEAVPQEASLDSDDEVVRPASRQRNRATRFDDGDSDEFDRGDDFDDDGTDMLDERAEAPFDRYGGDRF
jgi:hypothetical protein